MRIDQRPTKEQLAIKVGDPVVVVKDNGPSFYTFCTIEPWKVSGIYLLGVSGIAGGYLLSRCWPCPSNVMFVASTPTPEREFMTRKKLDQYFTPPELARELLRHLPCSGRVLEPSVGRGAFAMALRSDGAVSHVTGIDLEIQPGILGSVDKMITGDFLDHQGEYDWVVGNPPYKQAMEHIRHALTLAPNVGFLLRLSMLASQRRAGFWVEGHLRKVWILCQRPSFTGSGSDNSEYGLFWIQRELDVPAGEVGWIRRWR